MLLQPDNDIFPAVFAEMMTDDLRFGLFLSVPPCGGRGGRGWKLEGLRGCKGKGRGRGTGEGESDKRSGRGQELG